MKSLKGLIAKSIVLVKIFLQLWLDNSQLLRESQSFNLELCEFLSLLQVQSLHSPIVDPEEDLVHGLFEVLYFNGELLLVHGLILLIDTVDGRVDVPLLSEPDRFVSQQVNQPANILSDARILVENSVQVLSADEAISILVQQVEHKAQLVLVGHVENPVDLSVELLVTELILITEESVDYLV